MANEIERKYILKQLPAGLTTSVRIEQGYILANDFFEVRLRKEEEELFFTIKLGSFFIRKEFEWLVKKWFFDFFWPLTEGYRLKKIRYILMAGKWKYEIDQYFDLLTGLFIAEIELPNIRAEFILPLIIQKQIIKEVTYDKKYKNKNLVKIKNREDAMKLIAEK